MFVMGNIWKFSNGLKIFQKYFISYSRFLLPAGRVQHAKTGEDLVNLEMIEGNEDNFFFNIEISSLMIKRTNHYMKASAS